MPYFAHNNFWVGRKFELFAHFMLEGSVLETLKNTKHVFDITWEGYRINVKAAKKRNQKHGKYYNFKLHDSHRHCDFFLCYGYVNRRFPNPEKVWLIPSSLLEGKGELCIGVNHRGRWAPYEITDFKRRIKKENALKICGGFMDEVAAT